MPQDGQSKSGPCSERSRTTGFENPWPFGPNVAQSSLPAGFIGMAKGLCRCGSTPEDILPFQRRARHKPVPKPILETPCKGVGDFQVT
jgi:hypothetical protein